MIKPYLWLPQIKGYSHSSDTVQASLICNFPSLCLICPKEYLECLFPFLLEKMRYLSL